MLNGQPGELFNPRHRHLALYFFQPAKLYDEGMNEKSLEVTDKADLTVIQDGSGYMVIGSSNALELWRKETQIESKPADSVIRKIVGQFGDAAVFSGLIAENSGRWVKLTEESAQYLAAFGGNSGVVRFSNGQIAKHLEFVGTGAVASNPATAMTVGLAMSMMSLRQSIEEVQEYLEVVDKKLDAVIQDQKDTAISDLGGCYHLIEEVYASLEKKGQVTPIDWSKVSGTAQTLLTVQRYAVQKLETLSKEINPEISLKALNDALARVDQGIPDWLYILANAIQLQDKLSILELEHVSTEEPEFFEQHREAINEARSRRLRELEDLLAETGLRMSTVWEQAIKKQLIQPVQAKSAFKNLARVDEIFDMFSEYLDIETNRWDASETNKWHEVVGAKATVAAKKAKEAGRKAVDGVQKTAHKVPKVEIKLKQRDSES